MKLKYSIECWLLKTEKTFARSRCFCHFELVNVVRTCGEVEDDSGREKAKAKVGINFINYSLLYGLSL